MRGRPSRPAAPPPTPTLRLSLDGLVLRPFGEPDAEPLAVIADDRRVWRNLIDRFPHPYTLADARQWIAHTRTLEPGAALAIEVDGRFAGAIGLERDTDVYRRTAELGYWLGEPYWGRGLATRAVRGLCEWAFASTDLCRIQAGVFEWNPAPARVLEKSGFHLESRRRCSVVKDGQLIDQLVYVRRAPGLDGERR